MRKLLLLAVMAGIVGIFAASGTAATGGTVVDRGFACNVFDGTGFVTTFDSRVTVYDSGKVVMKCNAWGARPESLTFLNYANTGLACGYYGLLTWDGWSTKVGRNGNAQLTCTFWMSDNVPTRVSSGGVAGNG